MHTITIRIPATSRQLIIEGAIYAWDQTEITWNDGSRPFTNGSILTYT